LVNTALLGALLCGFAVAVVKNWSNWSTHSKVFWGVFLVLQGAVYPYIRVLLSHRKIRELYVVGKITEQPAASVIDELLSVADNALNDGFFYSIVTFGMLLIFGIIFRLK
jgi:hypothetical protein